jgi:hypothetical protein
MAWSNRTGDERVLGWLDRITKHQAPNLKQTPNSKGGNVPNPAINRSTPGFGSLVFGTLDVFGFWCL